VHFFWWHWVLNSWPYAAREVLYHSSHSTNPKEGGISIKRAYLIKEIENKL
jgi:hypothetical protein